MSDSWPTPQAHDAMSPKTPAQIASARERAAPRETGGKPGFSNLNEVVQTWEGPMDVIDLEADEGEPGVQSIEARMEPLPESYEDRKKFEFFTTDPNLAVKVCQRIAEILDRPPANILEPSAGDGAFIRAARLMWPVAGTSLIAVEPLMAARPLLLQAGATEVSSATLEEFAEAAPERIQAADLILGNPPFTLAEKHLRLLMKQMKVGARIAFLLRLGFYGAEERQAFWAEFPEEWMFPISPRPSFLGETGKGKTDGQEYGLFVFRKCETAELQAAVKSRRGPLITWEKTSARARAAASTEAPVRKKRAKKNGTATPDEPAIPDLE